MKLLDLLNESDYKKMETLYNFHRKGSLSYILWSLRGPMDLPMVEIEYELPPFSEIEVIDEKNDWGNPTINVYQKNIIVKPKTQFSKENLQTDFGYDTCSTKIVHHLIKIFHKRGVDFFYGDLKLDIVEPDGPLNESEEESYKLKMEKKANTVYKFLKKGKVDVNFNFYNKEKQVVREFSYNLSDHYRVYPTSDSPDGFPKITIMSNSAHIKCLGDQNFNNKISMDVAMNHIKKLFKKHQITIAIQKIVGDVF